MQHIPLLWKDYLSDEFNNWDIVNKFKAVTLPYKVYITLDRHLHHFNPQQHIQIDRPLYLSYYPLFQKASTILSAQIGATQLNLSLLPNYKATDLFPRPTLHHRLKKLSGRQLKCGLIYVCKKPLFPRYYFLDIIIITT